MSAADVVVTLDTDWAPGELLEAVAERLEAADVPATWFVTDATPVLDRLRERFELGAHPNFRPGSSHGETPEAVLAHVRELVPEAVSVRSHGVLQWGGLMGELARAGYAIDSSTFLPGMAHVGPVVQQTPHGPLTRIPFVWADDYEPAGDWEARLAAPGLKVLDFHPVHVCADPAPFEALLEQLAGSGRACTLREAT